MRTLAISVESVLGLVEVLDTPNALDLWREGGRWFARWTMPGYLDCGDTHEGDSEVEALEGLLLYDTSDLATGVDDWEADALRRLAELAAEGDKTALELLVRQLPEPACKSDLVTHGAQADGVCYSGDANPIDHNGAWFETTNWRVGYACCVRVVSAENKLWLERGTIHNGDTSDAAIASEYDMPVDEITDEVRIDYQLSNFGMEVYEDFGGRHVDEYTRIDYGWFVDAEGDLFSESMLSDRVADFVEQLTR